MYKNTPYTATKLTQADSIEAGNPIPSKVGQASPIKHVFYIIKENRTYDQVLADMPGGNGDTSLLLFGKILHRTNTPLPVILFYSITFM